MITQTHPEISITFRRLPDGKTAVMVVGRKSKDPELSRRALIVAEALKLHLPAIIEATEIEIAKADAKKNATSEVMH